MALQKAMVASAMYEVVGDTSERMTIRICDGAESSWSEDAELFFGEVLQVVCHRGSRDQREALLALLVAVFAECGQETHFREI